MTAGTARGREAVILAGGLGTRLASVLPDRQKVTAEIGGQPFALRLAQALARRGVTRIVFAAGHRAADVQTVIDQAPAAGPRMEISVEAEPLGTGGALRLALERTTAEPLLVMNGDSFADVDIDRLYDAHARRSARVTLATVKVEPVGRYGLVESREDGRVLAFDEKPTSPPPQGWINAGVYLFAREVVAAMPRATPFSLERDVFPALVGHGLYAVRFEAPFIDIGTPESLQAAQTFFGGC